MYWGATTDRTIYKCDDAVHQLMKVIFATRQFTMCNNRHIQITSIALYYLIPPFKWTHVGIKNNIWYENVESFRKDVERCFGILKKRSRCLINHVELQDPVHSKCLFNSCATLHSILLDYSGIGDWENRMNNASFGRKNDSFLSVNIHQSQVISL
jgi:hypothetical protein